jgi:hypothetical protein
MKYLLILLLAGCATTPKNPEKYIEWENNSCLPTAITMHYGLRNSTKWSEVLLYQYTSLKTGETKGHAVCAYIYPIGSNKLWVYDYEGSTRIKAYINDPLEIAQLAEVARGRIANQVSQAEYLKK